MFLFHFQHAMLLLFGCTLCQASCIPPFSLSAVDHKGIEQSHTFLFDGTTNSVAELDLFFSEHDLDVSHKVAAYEAIVRHFTVSASREIIVDSGEVFMQFEDKAASLTRLHLVSDAMAGLPEVIFPTRVWTTSSSPAYQVVLHGHDEYMTHQIMRNSAKWLFAQIDKMLGGIRRSRNQQPGVVVDIGANLGMVALYAAAKGERVVAFEATSTTSQKLRASCIINGWCPADGELNSNDRFAIFENAVSDIDGKDVTMRLNWLKTDNTNNEGSNSMFGVASENESDSTCSFETKKTITLDTALASMGLLPVDDSGDAAQFQPKNYISILKMDCEGCEPLALLGASRLFRYNPPLSILAEVNVERLGAAGSSPFAFLSQLDKLGYDIYHQSDGTKMSPITEESVLLAMSDSDIDCVGIYRNEKL
jgi:FkbM family methyltransferase